MNGINEPTVPVREPPDESPTTRAADGGSLHTFRALAHPRQRLVCRLLAVQEEWHLDDLATEIARREADEPGGVQENARNDEPNDGQEGPNGSPNEGPNSEPNDGQGDVPDDDQNDPPDEVTDAVRVTLVHHHLPALAECEIVEFDPHHDVVVRGQRQPVARSVLAGVTAVIQTSAAGRDEPPQHR